MFALSENHARNGMSRYQSTALPTIQLHDGWILRGAYLNKVCAQELPFRNCAAVEEPASRWPGYSWLLRRADQLSRFDVLAISS